MTSPLPSEVTPGPDHAAPETTGDKLMAKMRKLIVGAFGLLGQVAASGVFDDADDTSTRLWVQAILAAGTAYGIYRVPNAPAAPEA